MDYVWNGTKKVFGEWRRTAVTFEQSPTGWWNQEGYARRTTTETIDWIFSPIHPQPHYHRQGPPVNFWGG